MTAQISLLQYAAMVVAILLAIGFPLTLLFVWRKKTKAPWVAALVGAGIFVVFALVLESLLHSIVLQPGGYVASHAWSFALYGALAAGVFEETGRFFGYKVLLKKHSAPAVGVMYGIGHGGIEAVLLGGLAAISNLATAFMYAGGNVTPEIVTAGQTIAAASAPMLMVAGLERVSAVCFHIAMSVLVFRAVHRPGKLWLYPAAILLHAALDLVPALYKYGALTNIWLIEGIVAVFTVLVSVLAVRLYREDAEAYTGE